ncbi:hypothetical protein O988_06074 [Pseudogymnoascus sp. VKM F-3808]|nr:hypothetical protein O988_06074 [Pseudogymnoascus sp. VKM F-3808]
MDTILPRRPPHGDVTKIPTPPLQAAGLFINFVFPALALIFVCLRAYCRVKIKQWGADDYAIVIALMFSLLMCGPFYMYIKLNYFGWRAVNVPKDFDPSPGMWWFYLAQIFYNPVLAFVKASVLLFLLRLGGQKKAARYAIYALFTFNALQAIAVFLVATLQCLPISANWDASVKATCVDVSFHVTISALTIFTDVLVLVLPFWIFLGLNMPNAQKVTVIGAFLLGTSVTVVAIVRFVELYRLFYVPNPDGDPFHSIGITLSTVEVNVAIISATIPALRPLGRLLMPTLFAGSSANYYNTSRSGGNLRSDNPAVYNRHGTSVSIAMKSMRDGTQSKHTECRSVSPNDSEEEIMTYHGIVKSTDVRVQFDSENDDRSSSRMSNDHKGSRYNRE